jgi:hypothetical protein
MGLMLVVFLVGSTPPEYIHDIFVHHTEGIDPVLKKGETVMMTKHNHCSFLGFEFTPFITTDKEYLLFEHITYLHSWSTPFYYFHFSSTHKVVSLRGPPTLVV